MFSLTQHNRNSLVSDTGDTDHYIHPNTPNVRKAESLQPISFRVPNGDLLRSTNTFNLKLPKLKESDKKSHIIPTLKNISLLST